MASKNLQRRHAKAVHRKKVLQERRRLETTVVNRSLAHDVRRAAAAPVHDCLVQESIFESGVGMVFLIRKTGANSFALGGFLVDAYCLGVKDAMFREVDETEMEALLDGVEATDPLTAVDLPYARKLLRDAAAYAQSLGLPPHPDYAAVEPLFGEANADACDVQFQFGYEGRPLYVPGPTESPTQIRRRLDRLRRKLGDDGFDFGAPDHGLDALEDANDEDDEDDEDEIDVEGAYDPAIAPDPTEWLALDEDERLSRVKDYHRHADPSLLKPDLHAIIHMVIENQVAMGDELPVRRTLERLVAEGLDRHEALHALGTVLAARIGDAIDDPKANTFPADVYSNDLERITAEGWRRQAETDGAASRSREAT